MPEEDLVQGRRRHRRRGARRQRSRRRVAQQLSVGDAKWLAAAARVVEQSVHALHEGLTQHVGYETCIHAPTRAPSEDGKCTWARRDLVTCLVLVRRRRGRVSSVACWETQDKRRALPLQSPRLSTLRGATAAALHAYHISDGGGYVVVIFFFPIVAIPRPPTSSP